VGQQQAQGSLLTFAADRVEAEDDGQEAEHQGDDDGDVHPHQGVHQVIDARGAHLAGAEVVLGHVDVEVLSGSLHDAPAQDLHRLRRHVHVRVQPLEHARFGQVLALVAHGPFVGAHVEGVVQAAHDRCEQAQGHGEHQRHHQPQRAQVTQQLLTDEDRDVIGQR